MQGRQLTLIILVIVAGIVVISSWAFLITPQIIDQIDGYQTIQSYVGTVADVESLVSGHLPTPIFVIYESKLIGTNNNILEFSTTYTNYDAVTEEILWESEQTTFVDKNTRMYTEPANTYFEFPKNTQKQNYNVYVYDNGDPQSFVFEEETEFDGLTVYRFSCNLTADLTEFYPEYSPDKVFSDYECSTLIEPITGDEIQFEENWMDYIVQDGEKIPIEAAHTHTGSFAKSLAADNAKSKIRLFEIYQILVPTIMSVGVAGACIAIISIINKTKIKLQ